MQCERICAAWLTECCSLWRRTLNFEGNWAFMRSSAQRLRISIDFQLLPVCSYNVTKTLVFSILRWCFRRGSLSAVHHVFSQASKILQCWAGSGWMPQLSTLQSGPRLRCLGALSDAPINDAGLAMSPHLSREELKGLFTAKWLQINRARKD